jgi:hypothetical protein
MRRITLVAPVRDDAGERELRDTSGWLRELPIAWLTRVARLSEVALDQIDVLWIGSMLEPEWPAAVPLPDPLPPEFGIAGFGPPPCSPGCEMARSSDPPLGRARPHDVLCGRRGAADETHDRHEVRFHLRG